MGVLVFGYFTDALRQGYLKKSVIKLAGFIIFTSVPIVLSFIIYGSSNTIYSRSDALNEYRKYNKIRSDVTDYIPTEYSEEFSYDELEISYNDWYMMRCLVINDEVFSSDYFEQVIKNIEDKRDDKSDLLYNLRQMFFYRSGRVAGSRTQFYVSLLICVTALLVTKRRQQICILLDVLGTAVFIGYFLLGDRLPPWVSDSIYLLAMYIALIYLCCTEYGIMESNKGRYPIKDYIVGTVVLLCLCMNIITARGFARENLYNQDLKDAISYAESADGVFLLDNIHSAPYPYIDVCGATSYFSVGQWDNIMRVGNWDCGHPERNRQKEALGIDSVIYSLAEGKSMLISEKDSYSFEMYQTFLKEHYNVDVYFTLYKDFGEYGIYRCRKVPTKYYKSWSD